MLLLQDGVLAFLSAVGLTTIVWAAAGALLHMGGRPAIPGLLLVLPLKGEALAMEADVRELRRVQGSLPGAWFCRGTSSRKYEPAWRAKREDIPNGRAHLPGGHDT